MKVLIIDDDVQVATLLAEAVVQQGHEATVAHDGEEGLVIWEQQGPDAVFLDIKLGELSGIDVLRRIRRFDPRLPVVLITGHAGAEQVEEARRLGVAEVLQKPFVLKHLTDTLGLLTAPG